MLRRSQHILKERVKEMALRDSISKQTALRDLLTDLRHVSHDLGLDFEDAAEGSEEVFHEEVELKIMEAHPDFRVVHTSATYGSGPKPH